MVNGFAEHCVLVMSEIVFNKDMYTDITLPEKIPTAFVAQIFNFPDNYEAIARYFMKKKDYTFFSGIVEAFCRVVEEKATEFGMDKDIAVFFTRFFLNGFFFSALENHFKDGYLDTVLIDILKSFDLSKVRKGGAENVS